jgi:hypothetical protein
VDQERTQRRGLLKGGRTGPWSSGNARDASRTPRCGLEAVALARRLHKLGLGYRAIGTELAKLATSTSAASRFTIRACAPCSILRKSSARGLPVTLPRSEVLTSGIDRRRGEATCRLKPRARSVIAAWTPFCWCSASAGAVLSGTCAAARQDGKLHKGRACDNVAPCALVIGSGD